MIDVHELLRAMRRSNRAAHNAEKQRYREKVANENIERQEEIARLTVENRRQTAKEVQLQNERKRRFRELSDEDLAGRLEQMEDELRNFNGHVENFRGRQFADEWKGLLEERQERKREQSEVAAKFLAMEEQARNPRPYKKLSLGELREKTQEVRQRREGLERDALRDPTRRDLLRATIKDHEELRKERRIRGTRHRSRRIRLRDEWDNDKGR